MIKEDVLLDFPVTLAERLELGPDVVRFPASWEEYLDLLEVSEYPIEYANEEIIAMSIASDPHESIVANILGVLFGIFKNSPGIQAKGSNRHIFIPEFEADYAPDAHVVKGVPILHALRKGLTANTNPHILFEVLSPSTRDTDWSEKLPRYKRIASAQQIIYIEQTRPFVTVFNRIADSNRWETEDFDRLEHVFQIEGQDVLLEDLYLKVIFGEQAQ
jgi:Uma2 family endonuclease